MKLLHTFLAFLMTLAICACHGDSAQFSENILFNDDWDFFRMDSSVCMSEMQLIMVLFPNRLLKYNCHTLPV